MIATDNSAMVDADGKTSRIRENMVDPLNAAVWT
jgi:hypothetical protein